MTTAVPTCNRCHRRVPTGRLIAGYGVRCAARYGLRPERRPRVRTPASAGGGAEVPVLDGLNELMETNEEGLWDT